tara:strand:- start:168 stop:386 length:219 start_codon:yes stop_codon:yes gene_type:complete
MKTKIEYQLPNLSNDISHSDYQYILGSLDSLSLVFDYINNSKSNLNPKEILVFISDDMIKRGAKRLRVDIKP